MIPAGALHCPSLALWLGSPSNPVGAYQHFHFVENPSLRSQAVAELRKAFEAAHLHAKEKYESFVAHDLDPLPASTPTPVMGYPGCLHSTTLQAYIGEILAGILAEHTAFHGESQWRVPAFLFSAHEIIVTEMERAWRQQRPPGQIPGRTGDDCLAFKMENGKITKLLYCEAKCTISHNASLIANAHHALSTQELGDIIKLATIVREAKTAESETWFLALRECFLRRNNPPRSNLFVYVHAQEPIQRGSWMSTTQPHAKYTTTRHPLAAAEVRISDITRLISELYH